MTNADGSLRELATLRARAAEQATRNWPQETRKHIKGAPILLRASGLLQGLALLQRTRETLPIAVAIARWLSTEHPSRPLGAEPRELGDVIRRLTQLDQRALHALEEEATSYAELLRLLAEVGA
jgi:hypothetical protein